jgi:hypothetical protein
MVDGISSSKRENAHISRRKEGFALIITTETPPTPVGIVFSVAWVGVCCVFERAWTR